MKKNMLAALTLTSLPFPGKAGDDNSGKDKADDAEKADLVEYLKSL
jgi:hypothetical protein